MFTYRVSTLPLGLEEVEFRIEIDKALHDYVNQLCKLNWTIYPNDVHNLMAN